MADDDFNGNGGEGSEHGENPDPGISVSPDVGGWKADPNVRLSPGIGTWNPEDSRNLDANSWVMTIPDITRAPFTEDKLKDLYGPMNDWTPRISPEIMASRYKEYCSALRSRDTDEEIAAYGLGPDPVDSFTSTLKGIYGTVPELSLSPKATQESETPGLTDKLNTAWNTATNFTGKVIDSFSNDAGKAFDAAKTSAMDAAKGVGETVSKAVDEVKDGTGKAVDAVGEVAGKVVDAVKYGALGALNTVISSTGKEARADTLQAPANTESEPKPDQTVHQKIGEIALKAEKDYSKLWAYKDAKDNFKAERWKCNKFVADVLNAAGVGLGLPNSGLLKPWEHYPPTAGQ